MINRFFAILMTLAIVLFFGLGIADANGRGHDRGHGYGHGYDNGDGQGPGRGHGFGHRGGHRGGGDCGVPENGPQGSSDISDATPSQAIQSDGIGNLPRGCVTDWQRATYPECDGLPYDLLLQGHPAMGVEYSIPVRRDGAFYFYRAK